MSGDLITPVSKKQAIQYLDSLLSAMVKRFEGKDKQREEFYGHLLASLRSLVLNSDHPCHGQVRGVCCIDHLACECPYVYDPASKVEPNMSEQEIDRLMEEVDAVPFKA